MPHLWAISSWCFWNHYISLKCWKLNTDYCSAIHTDVSKVVSCPHMLSLKFFCISIFRNIWRITYTCRSEDLQDSVLSVLTPNLDMCGPLMPAEACTGSCRNSELIINTNNIFIKVINDNFSMLQFTVVLKLFLHYFTFVYNVFQVATTLLNAQVHISWEAAHFLKCFFWNVDKFFTYCLFECI
jgi:hypothetical protein